MRCNVQVNTHHFQRLHLHLHPQAGTNLCRHNCTCTFTCGSTYAFVFDTSTALIPATSTRCRGGQQGQTEGYPCVSNRYTVKHNHISYVLCRYTCYKIHCYLHLNLHLHMHLHLHLNTNVAELPQGPPKRGSHQGPGQQHQR